MRQAILRELEVARLTPRSQYKIAHPSSLRPLRNTISIPSIFKRAPFLKQWISTYLRLVTITITKKKPGRVRASARQTKKQREVSLVRTLRLMLHVHL
jgi:hypothetical protein